jgi:anti-sigma B factor antagonist
MQITERSVGAVTVLDLDGKLVSGGDLQRLKDKVNSLVFQNRKQLIFDLGKVAQIDSSGLGELVTCLTTATRAGGNIKLLNVTKRNQDLLSITRLATVFDTFDSEAEAVRSFGAATTA